MNTTQQPARKARSRARLWPRGLHIAPYLSPSGRFVLVALGTPHWFIVAAEVESLAGSFSDGRKYTMHTAAILEPSEQHDGMIPFISPYSAGLKGRSLEALLWSRGVHAAPWQYGIMDGGRLIMGRPHIAVDARHRLVAEMFVANGIDPEPTRRDLMAILESVEESAAAAASSCATPESGDATWRDTITDDEDDDDGDEWKRGARV